MLLKLYNINLKELQPTIDFAEKICRILKILRLNYILLMMYVNYCILESRNVYNYSILMNFQVSK